MPPEGPDGGTADLNAPHAHGAILLQALTVLEGDGRSDGLPSTARTGSNSSTERARPTRATGR